MNMNPICTELMEAANAVNTAPDDYINPADGLKYCGKCHTPKEAFFPDGMSFNGSNKHPTPCECAANAMAEEKAAENLKASEITWLHSAAKRSGIFPPHSGGLTPLPQ